MKVLFMSLALVSTAAIAEVVKVPATHILNAARTVVPQTALSTQSREKSASIDLDK